MLRKYAIYQNVKTQQTANTQQNQEIVLDPILMFAVEMLS